MQQKIVINRLEILELGILKLGILKLEILKLEILSWRYSDGDTQAGNTLSRALMTSTSTRKGGAAATIWQTYWTAAAPFTAPSEMSAAKPEPAAR